MDVNDDRSKYRKAGFDIDNDMKKIKQGLGLSESDTGRIERIIMSVVNNITGETVLSGKMTNDEVSKTSSSVREELFSLTLQMDDLSVNIYVNEENLNKLVDYGGSKQ